MTINYNTALYGRKWQMSIVCTDGSKFSFGQDGIGNAFETNDVEIYTSKKQALVLNPSESLKVDFHINYPGYQGWYFSEFTIWNLNRMTEQKIIAEGSLVYFYAGYSKGRYGLLFSGTVFQSLYGREDNIDYKLHLYCIDGYRLFKSNFTEFSLSKDYSDMTLINQIASRSSKPIEIGKVTGQISSATRPRGVVVFGEPQGLYREIMRNNKTQMFVKDDKLQVQHVGDAPQGDAIVINPDSGLIGTPVQIDYGVEFRCLLNPELVLDNPPRYVKLDLTRVNVKMQQARPGERKIMPLPKDGFFKIGGVRHSGDTRGNEWYTDVIGYAMSGKQPVQGEVTLPEMLPKEGMNPNNG